MLTDLQHDSISTKQWYLPRNLGHILQNTSRRKKYASTSFWPTSNPRSQKKRPHLPKIPTGHPLMQTKTLSQKISKKNSSMPQ
mmetsp:Transcript_4910/g.5537  ORF Transcript_4910/g.5537 Transcript_4910/m.5537 type:complete len:83 (+) Transcript_4910:685-933(+)